MLIRGGTIIDPSQGLHAKRDLRLNATGILDIADGLRAIPAEEIINAQDLLVVPGLIDLHVHVFWGVSHYGLDADENCLPSGTTTVVDAGSAGALTFPAFRRYIIDVAYTRILPFLNISAMGMLSAEIGELEDIRFIDRAAALRTIESHRKLIQGIKVRLSRHLVGSNAWPALRAALEVSEAADLPIMVHVGDTSISLTEIVDELRGGDVLTHCFHGYGEGILDEKGRVLVAARRAAARGVQFDVGHGRGSFAFTVARQALAQGFRPTTISTDLHVYNRTGPVVDLATTMSKFLHLGLPLDEIVEMTTSAPARVLRAPTPLGTLKPGAAPDVTLLQRQEGRFELADSVGQKVVSSARLVPVAVIRNGVFLDTRPSIAATRGPTSTLEGSSLEP